VCCLAGCSGNQSIVNNLEEREANEIVVFLASKGIPAQKVASVATGAAAATGAGAANFDIVVDMDKSTEAMALLNRYGLPRRKGTNLLELFAPSGFMTSDKQETIRYQAGLAEQLRNTIRKIDGVIDADVQLSFPSGEAIPGVPQPKTTAAVYVKHQGILEDPNSHIETKIKRLLAGSVNGLDFDSVSVISDRARFADITLTPDSEMVSGKTYPQTYVSLWSVVMTKSSVGHFRLLFFSLIGLLLLLATLLGFMLYKFYPQLLPKKKSDEPPSTP
jgi:type III secretion protein J